MIRLQQRIDEKSCQVIMVTSDAELKRASESSDVKVIDPEDMDLKTEES